MERYDQGGRKNKDWEAMKLQDQGLRGNGNALSKGRKGKDWQAIEMHDQER